MMPFQVTGDLLITEQTVEIGACHCERENVGSVGLFDCLQVLNDAVGVFAQERIRCVGIGLVLACN